MSIPKIIHYCWFGRGEIPKHDQQCIDSWKKYCPDYEIIQWNEDNYDITQIPYTKEAYETHKWAFVSDYARIDLVYRLGGIYLDTDVELIKPLDDLLQLSAFAGMEVDSKCVSFGLGFGAEKGSDILYELSEHYKARHFKKMDGTLDLTPNPIIVSEYLKMKGYELFPGKINHMAEFSVFPAEYFCPQEFSTGKTIITDNTYSIHHYHASWQTNDEKRALKAFQCYRRVFGEHLGELFYQTSKTIREQGMSTTMKKIISHIRK